MTTNEILQDELKKTTFLQDKFDYTCEHTVTETMDRGKYWDKLVDQFKDAKITANGYNLKLAAMEAHATFQLFKDSKVGLYFKIIT